MSLDVVRALGIKVIEVYDLGRDAQYVPTSRILLVEADLDQEDRDRISGRILDLEQAWACFE